MQPLMEPGNDDSENVSQLYLLSLFYFSGHFKLNLDEDFFDICFLHMEHFYHISFMTYRVLRQSRLSKHIFQPSAGIPRLAIVASPA